MGRPVVHFEIAGSDGPALHRYYAELFDWRIDAANPMGYGLVSREENLRVIGQFEVQQGAQPERFTVVINIDGKKARLEVISASDLSRDETIQVIQTFAQRIRSSQ